MTIAGAIAEGFHIPVCRLGAQVTILEAQTQKGE